ncbi:MAG: VCBS repeat-containing protein, partial [Deltaproteobacteria bacterium]|nr:VCBS repeat-containing protein [Deltaproteobacteria bacterium]
MKNKIILIFSFFLSFISIASQAAETKRVGLATYEIVSGENIDYLKKAISETLSASLQEKNQIQIISLALTEDQIKKRGVSSILQKEGLDAIVVGSVVKVGAPLQLNSRVYTSQNDPKLISATVPNLDQLLPSLKGHAQSIMSEFTSLSPSIAQKTVSTSTENEKSLKTSSKKTVAPAVESSTPSAPLASKGQEPTVSEKKSTSAVSKKQKESTVPVSTSTEPVSPSNPDYRWITQKLPYEGRGMSYADLDGDGKKEVVIIDLKTVYVYELSGNQLKLLAQYQSKSDDHFVRVFTYDLQQDGKSEILVSNLRMGQAASMVLQYQSGNITPLISSTPWLVKVLQWDGKPTLIGEPYYGTEVDRHKIRKLKLEGSSLKEDGELETPGSIGIYGLESFQSTSQTQNQFAYLTLSGSLKVFGKEGKDYKKLWSSSESYGGSANWISLKTKSYFNETEESKTFFNLDPVTFQDSSG